MSSKWAMYSAGWLSCAAIHSLHQDAMGKEEYLRHTAATWVSWHVTVPIALALLALSVVVAVVTLRGEP